MLCRGLFQLSRPRDGWNRPGLWSDWLESNVLDDIADAPVGLIEVFARTVPMPGDNGCLIWPKVLDRDGYGAVEVNRRHSPRARTGAHRMAYLLVHQRIPTGYVLDHLCRNRACVNPNHLEPVTNAENTQRGALVIRDACRRGHPIEGNAKVLPNGYRLCMPCQREWQRLHGAKYRRRYRDKKRAQAGPLDPSFCPKSGVVVLTVLWIILAVVVVAAVVRALM